MSKYKSKQLEDFQMVRYRMEDEGFHYCFRSYSEFEEVEDPRFHELRLAYLEAAKNLETYIYTKISELGE